MSTGPKLTDLEYDEWFKDDDTDKAHLFVFGSDEVWLPKSVVEIHEGDRTVTVPTSLVEEKGLEYYAK